MHADLSVEDFVAMHARLHPADVSDVDDVRQTLVGAGVEASLEKFELI